VSRPQTAFEIVSGKPGTVVYDGQEIQIGDVVGGYPLLHAVSIVGDDVKPECGRETGRLVAIGQVWPEPWGGRMELCDDCLAHFPLSEG